MKSLARHFSNYSLGSIAVTLAGLVSFPLLTRLLGAEGYGQMSLVTVTLIPLVAFGKCGLQHASMVFYSETRTGGNAWSLDQYHSTLVLGIGASGAVVTLLWLAVVGLLHGHWDRLELADLFLVAAPLIFVRVLHSAMLNILRAREKSGAAALWQVLHRYVVLAFVVGALLLVEASARMFFVASVAAESLVLALMATRVLKDAPVLKGRFSRSLFRAMAVFGVPMLGYEVAAAAANIMDRYVIRFLLGAGELGKYAAAYNLSEYAAGTLVTALSTAVLPMYMRVWSEEGSEATSAFVARSLKFYVFAAIPLAAGFSAVAGDFLVLMASDAYAEGADAIPMIIWGLVVNGMVIMLAAGLYVTKQSRKLMYALGGAAAVNLPLNFLLVPLMGIEGAALATLVTYVLYALVAWWMASPYLRVRIPWYHLGVYAGCGLAMYLVVTRVSLPGPALALAARVAVGTLVYGGLVFVMDPESRELFRRLARRRQG